MSVNSTGGSGKKTQRMKPRAPTVGARFCGNLSTLMEQIQKATPWFVKCVKPNQMKQNLLFDYALVHRQVK